MTARDIWGCYSVLAETSQSSIGTPGGKQQASLIILVD